MENAIRDENRVTTLIGISNADGLTTVPIYVNPTTHRLKTAHGSSGSDLSDNFAPRDENFVPGLLGASSDDDGTAIPVYADPTTHELLVRIN